MRVIYCQCTEWSLKIILLTLAASRGVTDLYPSWEKNIEYARTIFCVKLSINNHIVGLVHKNHILQTRLMYHAACKVEFQPLKRLYSQLTFFNFYEINKPLESAPRGSPSDPKFWRCNNGGICHTRCESSSPFGRNEPSGY